MSRKAGLSRPGVVEVRSTARAHDHWGLDGVVSIGASTAVSHARHRLGAHWRKAPLALRHHPSVLAAAFVAALLVALAAAAEPFVTTAAASAALKDRLAELTPLGTGVQVRNQLALYTTGPAGELLAQADKREAAVRKAAAALGSVGPLDTAVLAGSTENPQLAHAGSFTTPVRLMARPGALGHVKKLTETSGPGVWISDLIARELHLKAGGHLKIGAFGFAGQGGQGISFRVKGIYHILAYVPQAPYWENFYEDIYALSFDLSPPPSFVFVSRAQFYDAVKAMGGSDVEEDYQSPVDPHGLTLGGARALVAEFSALNRSLRPGRSVLARRLDCHKVGVHGRSCAALSSLSSAVLLANGSVSAISPAVTLLSDAGILIALAVAGAAGVFLVRRRRPEAALLFARGERVATFAARTTTEAFLPTLVGGVVGFGIAFGITGIFAPTGSTDSGTVVSGLAHAAVTVVIGLALLTATASIAFLRQFDTGSRPLPWLRRLPWELPLLAVAFYLLYQVHSGHGLAASGASGTHHPTLAVFLFPLLLVAAVAGLAARAARRLLRSRSGGRVRAMSVAPYLALRRLAAARGVLVVLVVVSAVAFGALFYAESLAASLTKSTGEKAHIAAGSDVQGLIADSAPIPADFPYPVTRLQYGNQAATLDGEDGTPTDVMTVDPASMAKTIYWYSDWGPSDQGFLTELAGAAPEPLPVITTTNVPASTKAIWIEDKRFPVRILARVKAFPGMSAGVPLVITSSQALNEVAKKQHLFAPLGTPFTYIWAKGPPDQVTRALEQPPIQAYYLVNANEYLKNPDFLLATRTLAFMRTVAIAAGVLVLIGLLLYLQARQRSQAIASALAARMGLRRLTEIVSLALELGAILLFSAILGGAVAIAAAIPIVPHIDPLPEFPPSPVFSLPTTVIVIVAALVIPLAILAAGLTSWFASRTDTSEALRVA